MPEIPRAHNSFLEHLKQKAGALTFEEIQGWIAQEGKIKKPLDENALKGIIFGIQGMLHQNLNEFPKNSRHLVKSLPPGKTVVITSKIKELPQQLAVKGFITSEMNRFADLHKPYKCKIEYVGMRRLPNKLGWAHKISYMPRR